ncbi:hypothetical protein MMC21_004219 [Puttea exsequens]|nr:hypothetical protein [Puttea exsequens]
MFITIFSTLCYAQYATYNLFATRIFDQPFGNLAAFPTGNGTNAAIVTNDTSTALIGQLNGTYWVTNSLGPAYSLYMQPTANSDVFPSELISYYGYVGINLGLSTPGFSEGDEDGLLVWHNVDMANAGSWFGICPTLIPGYETSGVQYQVFWQSYEAPEFGTANCTTSIFHGVFE